MLVRDPQRKKPSDGQRTISDGTLMRSSKSKSKLSPSHLHFLRLVDGTFELSKIGETLKPVRFLSHVHFQCKRRCNYPLPNQSFLSTDHLMCALTGLGIRNDHLPHVESGRSVGTRGDKGLDPEKASVQSTKYQVPSTKHQFFSPPLFALASRITIYRERVHATQRQTCACGGR